jgi:hypothetical protein
MHPMRDGHWRKSTNDREENSLDVGWDRGGVGGGLQLLM